MLLAAAGIGLVLSLGSLTPVHTWAYEAVPPLQGLRAVHRFGIVVVFALAVLAGIGFSGCTWPVSPRRRTLATFVLLVLATGESFQEPFSYSRFGYAGRVHQTLATSRWPGAVLELPIYRRFEFHRNARYLLESTTHWRPLVNGFGGFAPPDFDQTARLAAAFPAVLAVAWLQEIGVGYVVAHVDGYPDPIRFLRGATPPGSATGSDVGGGGRGDAAVSGSTASRSGRSRHWRPRRSSRSSASSTALPTAAAARGLGRAFGFQSPNRFICYMESTVPESSVTLRLPVPMSGRFLDASTGAVLQELTVEASTGTDPPARVHPPPAIRE